MLKDHFINQAAKSGFGGNETWMELGISRLNDISCVVCRSAAD